MEKDFETAAAIIELHSKGYDQDFVLRDEHILYVQHGSNMPIHEFDIRHVLSLNQSGAHGRQVFIYALSALHSNLRGIMVTEKLFLASTI